MSPGTQRSVARALRAGGPEVIEVCVEELAPLKTGEVLVRVEAVGLNHAETLIRSGNYAVRLPFPYPLGSPCLTAWSRIRLPRGTGWAVFSGTVS